MKYSRSESTQLHARYRDRFGELPEGLPKHAANQGQYDQMLDGMKLALETGNLPNWGDYVTPHPTAPLWERYHAQFGDLPEGLTKHAANQGQGDNIEIGMAKALETGQAPNWDDYVTPYPTITQRYREHFGELPEGLAKHAANQGQTNQLFEGMEKALETGQAPNWDDYVTPYPKCASPLTRRDLAQFGDLPEWSGETCGESGSNGTIIRRNEADAENRESAELERLRDAISEVFEANRRGKRVDFGKL